MAGRTPEYPLFSVVVTVKNRTISIRRCIESIIMQDYPHVEIIVQDGGSTDGTLDILREYAGRIKLISATDRGAGDAFFKALDRVQGEYFCVCLSDEELLPGALSWAYAHLNGHPEIAAVYGDIKVTDIHGNIRSEAGSETWSIERYLCLEFTPHLAASFFRTKCWRTTGPFIYNGCGEYEFFVRLGLRFPLLYVPSVQAKYAEHEGALSFQKEKYEKQMLSCIDIIKTVFQEPDGRAYLSLHNRAVGGAYLRCALGMLNMNDPERARWLLEQGLPYGPAQSLVDEVSRRLGVKVAKTVEVAIGGVALSASLEANPQLIETIKRVKVHLQKGRTELACSIIQQELGHLAETAEILSRLRDKGKT
jgi:glycosyltransferase involved in cell wall biosynthesis